MPNKNDITGEFHKELEKLRNKYFGKLRKFLDGKQVVGFSEAIEILINDDDGQFLTFVHQIDENHVYTPNGRYSYPIEDISIDGLYCIFSSLLG